MPKTYDDKELNPFELYLQNLLKQNINGLAFNQFMHEALYHLDYGYYQNIKPKIGLSGDFTTAPEMSSLFAECLANFCLSTYPDSNILEFGAGSGQLAVDLISSLIKAHHAPEKYFILEISPYMRKVQQQNLKQSLPNYFSNVIWLDTLSGFKHKGLIIANEVLDAMPIHKFYINQGKLHEWHVKVQKNLFQWHLAEPSFGLKSALNHCRFNELYLQEDYTSEINLWLPAWFKTLNDCLIQGHILLTDYGFTHKEYYHPQRHMGTLMCHHLHQAHPDPLINVGQQDITAHVDFTHVAMSAYASNFSILGFKTQAAFLIECGLFDLAQKLNTQASAKILTSPNEMGERFKAILLGKNVGDLPPLGFRQFNQVYKLTYY